MAALPYDNVKFTWIHTGENGTTSQVTDGHVVGKEILSSDITLSELNRFSYGSVNCTATNIIGTGNPQTFIIVQRGEICI